MEASSKDMQSVMETDMKEEEFTDENGSDDSMSDETDEENEIEQNELIEKLQTTEKELEKNPFYYDKHVELIRALRKLKLKSKLREARQAMSKSFPLTEELWLEWLEDEEDDVEFSIDLLNKAVLDYQSIKLWLELALCQMKLPGQTSQTQTIVRDVFERALSQCALHCTEGALVWEAYIDYEMTVGNENDEDKYKKILNLITRQLSCPLMGLNVTYQKYKEIVGSDSVDKVAEGHYQRSQALLNKLLPYENALKDDQSLESYNKYIQFASSNISDPNLVVCLYERSIKLHCLQPTIWSSYLHYLTKHLRIKDVILPVCRRAVRNCPWSVDLWTRFLRALETFNASHDTVKATFTESLSMGMTQSFEYLTLWTSYIDYLRRSISWESDEKDKQVEEVREAFDNANNQLFDAYSFDGDPNCSLLQYQAFFEAKNTGDIRRARELFNMAVKGPLGRQCAPWLQYALLERRFGDVKSTRAVYQRGLSGVKDSVEWLVEEYVRFEREEGDLEHYEKALEKCDAHLKKMQEKNDKEAEKEMKKLKAQQNKETKKFQKNIEKVTNKAQKTSQKPAKSVDGETKDVVIKPYQKKRPPVFERDEVIGTVSAVSVDGFKVPTMPPPVKPQKRSKPGDEGVSTDEVVGAKKSKLSDGVSSSHDSDLYTVFVSNLDYNVSKEDIGEALKEAGSIREVRLVTNHKGQSKGYAYVSFENQESVSKALKLDRKTVQSRPMFVSKFKRSKNDPQGVNKFKFESTLEKNKVFVKNLAQNVTDEDLYGLFKNVGGLKDVRIATYRNGHSKGHAYVEFHKEESASQAVIKYDGHVLKEQAISVAISNPPPRRSKDLLTDDNYAPSLGGGKKIMGRKSQLSMLPRNVKVQPLSETPSMNNQDFRNMLLNK